MHSRCPRRVVLATAVTLVFPIVAAAQLAPAQLVLVCNANSDISTQLAQNYARARGVPENHIVALDAPVEEEIDREVFMDRLREPLRKALTDRGIADSVRCIVTFYDVPLRVRAVRPTPEALERASRLDDAYVATLREVLEQCDGLDRIARPDGAQARPGRGPDLRSDLKDILEHYDRVRSEAVSRVASAGGAPGENQALMTVLRETEGPLTLMQSVRVTAEGGDQRSRMRAAQIQQNARAIQQQIAALLDQPPDSPAREEARIAIRSSLGSVGALSRIDHDRRQLREEETIAAVDSELALLWYESFPAYLWVHNPANPRTAPAARRGSVEAPRPGDGPLLMVSRLDGPNPAIVQRMFEDAIAVEKAGLAGDAYVDASQAKTSPGYKACNDDLIALANLLDERTRLRATLDLRTELFRQGDCPNAALYCGWYSHKEYVPAFDFVRGAVAFHVASSEAVSLRDPRAEYWCKGLLADGAAATIGPVHEPYLAAFPMPTEFFGLLLTGQYSLAECYHISNPLLSWMMILIGDPLYRPFAKNPQLTVADVYPAPLIARVLPPLGASPPVASAPAAEDHAPPAATRASDVP